MDAIRRQHWTLEDVATLMRMHAMKAPPAVIAKALGVTVFRVYAKLDLLGDEARAVRAAHVDELVITLPKAGVRIVSKYQASWNPFEHHKVAA